MTLILASASASRRAMLDAAGVPHEAVPAAVDEASIKASLLSEKVAPRDIADALAEMKAVKVSQLMPGRLVLGGDSIVALDDGALLDKPTDRANAADHLRRLSGARHDLISAAVIALDGAPIWRHVGKADMHVRTLTTTFIDRYLDAEWPDIQGCVGCYRVEGSGAQLFSRIDGSQFVVMGMPLLEILAFLRARGVLAS